MIQGRLLVIGSLFLAPWVAGMLDGDINADGVVNVADRVALDAMLAERSPMSASADLDGDGQVTRMDAEALNDLILGRAIFERIGSLTVSAGAVGVSVEDVTVSAPGAASFSGTHIDVARADRDFGFSASGNSAVYRLDGIPYHDSESLTVSLPIGTAERGAEPAMMLVGEEVIAPSSMVYDVATRLFAAERVDGRLVLRLPICSGPPADLAGELPSTYRLYVQSVTGVAADEYAADWKGSPRGGLMLDLVGPDTLTVEQKQRVVVALANAAHVISGLGFDVHKRTSPVKIEVKALARGTCGLYQPSMVSLNWTSIDINQDLVTDAARDATLRRTVMHEYFHMIQAWYDPRSAFTQAKYNAPQLWIDEASAVWIEQFAAGGTTSDYMATNAGEVMKGLHVDCEGLNWTNRAAHARAQNHGYGMALMFQYLFADAICEANPTLVQIYHALASGTEPRQAFVNTVPDPQGWWDDMLVAYAQGEIGVPGVSFAQTRMNSVRPPVVLRSADVMSDQQQRSLMRHDEFQSSVLTANWSAQPPPPAGDRRLVAELVAPDDEFALMAFQPRAGRNSPCMLRGTGQHLGEVDGRFVTLFADRMSRNDGARTMGAGHYLMVRRLVDSPEGVDRPILNVWSVNTRVPFHFTRGTEHRRKYTVTGHIDCDQILYVEPSATTGQSPDFYVEPTGTIHMPVQLSIAGAARPDSFYTTTQYKIRVEHILADGGYSTEVLGTLPYADTVTQAFTISMNEDDVAVVLLIIAEEDLALSAPSGIYMLGTNMIVSLVFRYDSMFDGTQPTP